MRKMVAACLVALLLAGSSSLLAQETKDSTDAQKSKFGKWALQFAVDDEQIYSYLGSVVSIKKMTSETSAWRFGLSISMDPKMKTEEAEHRSNPSTADTTIYTTDSESNSRFYISARWQMMRHFGTVGKCFGYWAIGPVAGYAHRESSSRNFISGGNFSSLADDYNEFSIGAVLTLGVEWHPVKNFGLLGEYGIQPAYVWFESENVRRDTSPSQSAARTLTRKMSTSGFDVDATTVRLGLSVYF